MRNCDCGRLARWVSHARNPERNLRRWPAVLGGLTLLLSTGVGATVAPQQDPAAAAAILLKYQASPLAFERNAGQTDRRVSYLARGSSYQLFLTGPDATLKLIDGSSSPRTTAVRVRWLGADKRSQAAGESQLSGQVNYFGRAAPASGWTNVETYERVRYSSVYPGVDLVYYAAHGQFEYDLVLAPRAKPESIAFIN